MTLTQQRPIDEVRLIASDQLNSERRSALGQFMTPSAIADFMASLFRYWPAESRLLDPGAGIGSLTEAFVSQWSEQVQHGSRLHITAYEIEPLLGQYLRDHLGEFSKHGARLGSEVKTELIERDFIVEATFALSFGGPRFTHIILNPPYRKIGAASEYRLMLRKIGVETVNLYTAFLALAVALCDEGGEIVAIVPRSFCNGTYFRPFREWLLRRVALTHIHVFDSRKKAFRDDDVLQENVIVHLIRGAQQGPVTISSSRDASFNNHSERQVPFDEVVKPSDLEYFIHVPTVAANDTSELFLHTLSDIGLGVSTGPVVDFRVRAHWLSKPRKKAAPLLYTHHFAKGEFKWPREHRKPNALSLNDETRKWLMPRGWYTLTKRFSSKEERRRIVAYVVDPSRLPGELYGFENHLNVFHCGKKGLSEELARGIALFLNSTVVDLHFRTFSGHTQVNATDLRAMRFPPAETLIRFGKWAKKQGQLTQERIDRYITLIHAT